LSEVTFPPILYLSDGSVPPKKAGGGLLAVLHLAVLGAQAVRLLGERRRTGRRQLALDRLDERRERGLRVAADRQVRGQEALHVLVVGFHEEVGEGDVDHLDVGLGDAPHVLPGIAEAVEHAPRIVDLEHEDDVGLAHERRPILRQIEIVVHRHRRMLQADGPVREHRHRLAASLGVAVGHGDRRFLVQGGDELGLPVAAVVHDRLLQAAEARGRIGRDVIDAEGPDHVHHEVRARPGDELAAGQVRFPRRRGRLAFLRRDRLRRRGEDRAHGRRALQERAPFDAAVAPLCAHVASLGTVSVPPGMKLPAGPPLTLTEPGRFATGRRPGAVRSRRVITLPPRRP